MRSLAAALLFSALLALGCSRSATTSGTDGTGSTEWLLGNWIVDVEGSKQLDPNCQDSQGYFLVFDKNGAGFYGVKGQELAHKWELKGDKPEGKEVWLKNAQGQPVIIKAKPVDGDHIDVTLSAYGLTRCRMKRVAELPAGYKLPAPIADAPKTSGGSRKEVAAVLRKTDWNNNKVIVLIDGAEQKFDAADKITYHDYSSVTTNAGPLIENDVILVLEPRDGKEVVTEIRLAPPARGPSMKGTQVAGEFVQYVYNKKPAKLLMTVDGKDKEFVMADYVRWYDRSGRQHNNGVLAAFGPKMQIIAVLEKKGDTEQVIEVWEKK
jgi:hypothetical protein